MRIVEALRGKGMVTTEDGQQVSVEYDLKVCQEEISAGSMENPTASIPGMKSIEGHVKPVRFFGQELTLELEDKRKIKFFFTDMRGTIALRQWIG